LERPLSDLAPGGVCRAGLVTETALVSAAALSPSPRLPKGRRRSAPCGTVPRTAPGGRYPPPCRMEPGLSSAPEPRLRGRGCPADWSTRSLRRPSPARPAAVRPPPVTCATSPPPRPRPRAGPHQNGGMLILLPPSEKKTRPSEVGAAALDLEAMSLPQLGEARETMLRAAQRTAAGTDAAAPLAVYSGVLYGQLEAGQAPVEGRDVLIQSALFGLVDAFRDRIPAYRLSAGSALSRLGRAGSWWGRQLRPMAQELRAEQA